MRLSGCFAYPVVGWLIYVFAGTLIWAFVEANLLSGVGTTPGKWLLGIHVITLRGNKPVFAGGFQKKHRRLVVWAWRRLCSGDAGDDGCKLRAVDETSSHAMGPSRTLCRDPRSSGICQDVRCAGNCCSGLFAVDPLIHQIIDWNRLAMETILTLDIKTSITKSVLDVFDTMLSFQLEPVQDKDDADLKEMRIVGSVNFAGQVSGIIHIHVKKDFALIMASAMLGMTPDEIEGEDEIKDVICELSNIVGGNLKSFFNDSGFYCALSTPSITLGDDFTIKSLNTERYESLSFSYQQHTIRIEVGVKLQGGYQADDAVNLRIYRLRLESTLPGSGIWIFPPRFRIL